MDLKPILQNRRILFTIGGVLIVAIVMAAVYLPGTLFRGFLPVQQVQPTTQFTVSPTLPAMQIALTATCSVSPDNVQTGEDVTWTVKALGGSGNYEYAWYGSPEIVNKKSKTVTAQYDKTGDFYAEVIVTSGQDSVKANCGPVTVKQNLSQLADATEGLKSSGILQDIGSLSGLLEISCSANKKTVKEGDSVTYTVDAEGGDGFYDYTWLSDGLPVQSYSNSNTYERDYSDSGTYSVISVQVESDDGSKKSANCPKVSVAPSMTASCNVSPTTVEKGESVTWTAKTSKGSSPFSYEWQGLNEIVDKTSYSFTTTVNTVGIHGTSVLVTDSTGATATGKCGPITVEEKSLVFDPGVIGSGQKLLPGSSLGDSIEQLPGYQDASKVEITVECSADKNAVYADQTVLWTIDVEGIDETDISAYDWSGDVKGTDKNISVKYTTPGTREAVATITYNSNEFSSDTCSVMVLPKHDDEDEDDQGSEPKDPEDQNQNQAEQEQEDEEQTVQTEDIEQNLSACGTPYPADIEGHWAEAFIKRGYDLCLFKGIDGKFYPDRQATRMEAASMILYAKDLEPDPGCYDADCGTPFIDSPGIEAGAILRPLYYDDLVEGYDTYLFKPFNPITRAEAASLIVRAFFEPYEGCYSANCGAGWPDNFFNDITEMWQGQYIRVLWDEGIMTGSGPNRVEPNRYISRAEMAKMIVLAYENTH